MKKLNEMRIEKRLTSSFRITTMITSVAAIAAILVLLIISSRYTYALRYFGFAQGDIGQAIILFTDARGDTRAIVGYDDQSVISTWSVSLMRIRKGLLPSGKKWKLYWSLMKQRVHTRPSTTSFRITGH